MVFKPKLPTLHNEIAKMANEVGFHEVTAGDVELLNSHGESLTNEDLIELDQQRAEETTEEDQSERVLTLKFFQTS